MLREQSNVDRTTNLCPPKQTFSIGTHWHYHQGEMGGDKRKRGVAMTPLHVVRLIGLEPTRIAAPDPKSGVSTNSTTGAT